MNYENKYIYLEKKQKATFSEKHNQTNLYQISFKKQKSNKVL